MVLWQVPNSCQSALYQLFVTTLERLSLLYRREMERLPAVSANRAPGAECWAQLSQGHWVESLPPRELRYRPIIVPAAGDHDTIKYFKNNSQVCRSAAATLKCFSTAERYTWKPLLPRLQAHPREQYTAVRDLFCKTMHRLGITQISMLGDSLTWGMVQSLWSILAVRQRLPRYQVAASGSVACPHHPSVMFLINNATGRLPSDRINELAGNGTLTVINAGAHYSKAKGSSLSDFTNDLRTVASALAAMPSRGLVVWRSMHVPHPMCEEEDNPWPPEHAAMRMEHLHARCMSKARPSSSCPANATSDKGYSWDIYPEFDKVARALLTPLGVRFLDITQLSRSRPDAHSKVRYGGGLLPPDCSHLAVPGVPDWWNLLLLSRITECEN